MIFEICCVYTLSLILLRYTYIGIKYFRILLELWSKYCCIDPCVPYSPTLQLRSLYFGSPYGSILTYAFASLFPTHSIAVSRWLFVDNLIFRPDNCCMDTLVTLGIEPRTLALLALRSTYWAMRPIVWSYWGLNPRPSAHKTDTLPTELYDHKRSEVL